MRRQRICLLTLDFVGPIRNGGMGTAFLAAAEHFTAAGHHVTVLYPAAYSETEPVTRWREHYAADGIDFVSLFVEGTDKELSFAAYQWLKTRSFDAIHFHEMRGIGYWTTVAKRCGLAFRDTVLICQVHSPTLWHFAHSAQFLTHAGELETDWMERRSCEGADIAIAPSRYILDVVTEMGWRLPANHAVMPNLLPVSFPIVTDPPRGARLVREPVFFGRLEERKGLGLFCAAIDRLIRAGTPPESVVFLGKVGQMGRVHALAWLAGATAHWPMPWRVVNDLGPHEARGFLAEPGRLAIIASRMENAPYVVLECLAAGLPFVAPDVGGIGELVAAEDHARVLYARNAPALAEALARALREGAAPARAAISPGATREAWLAWHDALAAPAAPAVHTAPPLVSVCMAAFNRHEPLAHAIASIERQTHPRVELILVDDASTDAATQLFLEGLKPRFAARGWTLLRNEKNSWQGVTRRRAAEAASGEFLLFMDDDNAAWPDEIATFVTAATHSGADILTCQMQAFRGDGPPPRHRSTRPIGWIPLGPCPSAGAFHNVFGDANMFMAVRAWERMGGFTQDRAYFEDWEFLQAATLAGLHLECVPEILFCYRMWEGAQTASHDPDFVYRSYARAMRPSLAAMPEALRPALRLSIERELAGMQGRHEAYWAHAPHPTPDQQRIGQHAPNGAEAMIAAAELLAAHGQRATARHLIAQALRIAPGHPHAISLAANFSETDP